MHTAAYGNLSKTTSGRGTKLGAELFIRLWETFSSYSALLL